MDRNSYNFSLRGWSYADFDNTIDMSNLVNGKPIYYIKNAFYQTYDSTTNAGTFYCINCYNVTIDGLTTTNNIFGVYLWGTYGSTVRNITASNNSIGVAIDRSNGNTITSNNFSNNGANIQLRYYSDGNAITYNNIHNGTGISIISSSSCTIANNSIINSNSGVALGSSANNNVIADNNISNCYNGLYLSHFSNFNTIKNNDIIGNAYGIQTRTSANYNNIYNNNFINNGVQSFIWDAYNNSFNLPLPTGGNYWSNWTTPDTNLDGFVDSPYMFYVTYYNQYTFGGQDNLPWAKQDGWRSSDSIAPITTIELSGTGGNNNWYTSDVQVTLTATDYEGSGVEETEYGYDNVNWSTYTVPFTVSLEGATMVYYKSTDNAGNAETARVQEIKIDKTTPVVNVNMPADGAEYILGQAVYADWSANDSLSGVVSVEATAQSGSQIDTSTVGQKTFTVSAVDNAGNTITKTVTYYVRYAFSGVLDPMNADGSSIFKFGSTVPVKMQLTDAVGNFVTDAVPAIYVAKITDSVLGTEEEAISTSAATSGNLFRYDSDANQYIFNLSTDDMSVGTWQIRIELSDGSSKAVEFSLR